MLFFTAIADVSNRLHIMVKMFFFVISIAKKIIGHLSPI